MTLHKKTETSNFRRNYITQVNFCRDVLGGIYDIAIANNFNVEEYHRVAREIRGDFMEIKWRVEDHLKDYEFGK